MALSNIALPDTFDLWRVRTNQIVTYLNLLDSANIFSIVSNSTPLVVNGDSRHYSNVYLTLTVSSSNADVSTTNIASPFLANSVAQIARGAFGQANGVFITSSSAYAQANAAFLTASAAYGQSNSAFITASAAFAQANNANSVAYGQAANNALVLQVYGQANVAYDQANSAYNKANVVANNTVSGISRFANVTDFRVGTANTTSLDPKDVFDAAAEVTLADAGTIAVDFSTFFNANVTLGGNRTLGAPTNIKNGQSGYIKFKQDGVGNRTLSYSTAWKFAGGTTPSLSIGAGNTDLLFYQTLSDNVFASLVKDIR